MKSRYEKAIKDLCIAYGNWMLVDGNWENVRITKYEAGVGLFWRDGEKPRYRAMNVKDFLEKVDNNEVRLGCENLYHRRDLVDYAGNLEIITEYDEVK